MARVLARHPSVKLKAAPNASISRQLLKSVKSRKQYPAFENARRLQRLVPDMKAGKYKVALD